jgi:hypothetical protein
MDVCVYVCVCVCSSITLEFPGGISTKLGTHIAICMYNNVMYIFYIYMKGCMCVCLIEDWDK